MKKSILTSIAFIASFFAIAQCNLNYSTGTHSVCVNPTYELNTAFSTSVLITATGAQAYTWTANGTTSVGTTFIYNPTVAGVTNLVLTGLNGSTTCTLNITLTAVACTYTASITHTNTNVGIQELNTSDLTPIYYNMQGQVIDKVNNMLIIEQIGNRRKKVYIID